MARSEAQLEQRRTNASVECDQFRKGRRRIGGAVRRRVFRGAGKRRLRESDTDRCGQCEGSEWRGYERRERCTWIHGFDCRESETNAMSKNSKCGQSEDDTQPSSNTRQTAKTQNQKRHKHETWCPCCACTTAAMQTSAVAATPPSSHEDMSVCACDDGDCDCGCDCAACDCADCECDGC